MHLKTRIFKFLKENTLVASFGAIIAIIIGSLITFIGNIRRQLIYFIVSLFKKEHFPIYLILILLAVFIFFLYKKLCIMKKDLVNYRLLKSPTSPQAESINEFFLFSNNANWKINLLNKSFDRNPYCICCKPPNPLVFLPKDISYFQFFSSKDTHKCIISEKTYSLLHEVHVYAYQEARKKYGVFEKDIENEILKLAEERKQKK